MIYWEYLLSVKLENDLMSHMTRQVKWKICCFIWFFQQKNNLIKKYQELQVKKPAFEGKLTAESHRVFQKKFSQRWAFHNKRDLFMQARFHFAHLLFLVEVPKYSPNLNFWKNFLKKLLLRFQILSIHVSTSDFYHTHKPNSPPWLQ